MKNNRLTGLLCMITLPAFSQAPVFQATYDVMQSFRDRTMTFVPMDNGNFLLAGATSNYSNCYNAAAVFVIDGSGAPVWSKTYDNAGDVTITTGCRAVDGNYILAGTSNMANAVLMKLDTSGNVIWNINFGSTNEEYVKKIVAAGQAYYVAGYYYDTNYNEQAFAAKVDDNGVVQWYKDFGYDANSDITFCGIEQTDDGNLFLAGNYSGAGVNGLLSVKMDYNGNILFSKVTTGGMTYTSSSGMVKCANGGGYVVTGWGAYAVRFDNSGNAVWGKRFGTYDEPTSVTNGADGGFLIAGSTSSINPGADMFLLKLDESGNKEWDEDLQHTDEDMAFCVGNAAQCTYGVAGYTRYSGQYQSFFARADINGNTGTAYPQMNYTMLSPSVTTAACTLIPLNSGMNSGTYTFTVTNYASISHATISSGVAGTGNCTLSVNDQPAYQELTVYPNPSSGIFTVHNASEANTEIEIFSSLGEKISTEKQFMSNDLIIDISAQPDGIYFVRIISGRTIYSARILKQ